MLVLGATLARGPIALVTSCILSFQITYHPRTFYTPYTPPRRRHPDLLETRLRRIGEFSPRGSFEQIGMLDASGRAGRSPKGKRCRRARRAPMTHPRRISGAGRRTFLKLMSGAAGGALALGGGVWLPTRRTDAQILLKPFVDPLPIP